MKQLLIVVKNLALRQISRSHIILNIQNQLALRHFFTASQLCMVCIDSTSDFPVSAMSFAEISKGGSVGNVGQSEEVNSAASVTESGESGESESGSESGSESEESGSGSEADESGSGRRYHVRK